MPPKRKSTDAQGPAKKSRPAAKSPTPVTDPEITAILNKRWSPVSVTRNADKEFRLQVRDPAKAFTFICLGRVPWISPEDEDDKESDSDETDEEELQKIAEEKRKNEAVSTP